MKYSYEFKKKCVDMYREGRWAATPDGVKDPKNFQLMIRRWVRIEDENGPEALKHQGRDKKWTPEEKLDLVTKVLAGETNQSVAIEAGISDGLLYKWVRRYKIEKVLSRSGGTGRRARLKIVYLVYVGSIPTFGTNIIS